MVEDIKITWIDNEKSMITIDLSKIKHIEKEGNRIILYFKPDDNKIVLTFNNIDDLNNFYQTILEKSKLEEL